MSEFLYVAEYQDRFGGQCPSHKKIGIGINVPARMRSLSDTKGTIDVVALGVWKTINGETIQKIELELHKRFAQQRLNGEWFSDENGTMLGEVEKVLCRMQNIERVAEDFIPKILPPKVGESKGHFDHVSKPKGRRRAYTQDEVIGQLQAAYAYLIQRLPEEYVALNDNGPYIRANRNNLAFWIEPKKSGIKLNFWAGEKTPDFKKINELLELEYDGEAITRLGSGKSEGLHQFAIFNMSLVDLEKILDHL